MSACSTASRCSSAATSWPRGTGRSITTARSARPRASPRRSPCEHAPRDVLELALKTANAHRRRVLRRRHQDRRRPPRAHGGQRQPERRPRRRGRDPRRRALRSHHERDSSARRCRQTVQTRRLNRRQGGRSDCSTAYGLEVEYMLVDGETLDVAPAADQLLEAAAGELTDEFENGDDRLEQRARAARHRAQVQRAAAVARGLGQGIRRQREARERQARPRGFAAHADGDAPVDGPERGRAVAARHARHLRHVRPDLLVQGPRLGQPAEHADQPAVRRRRGVRAAACRDSFPAADPAGSRGELADRRRRAQRHSRQPPGRLSQQLRDASRRSRARSCRSPSARSANTTSACSSRSTATSRRTIPKASCATNGSTRAARSRASTAWRSRSACSTCKRRPLMDVAYAALIVEVLEALCAEQWLDRERHESLAHRGARQAAHARGAARRGCRYRRQAISRRASACAAAAPSSRTCGSI